MSKTDTLFKNECELSGGYSLLLPLHLSFFDVSVLFANFVVYNLISQMQGYQQEKKSGRSNLTNRNENIFVMDIGLSKKMITRCPLDDEKLLLNLNELPVTNQIG